MPSSTRLIAIDPGCEKSGLVVMDGETVIESVVFPNDHVVAVLASNQWNATLAVIEMVACYGMPVGKEVFETCVWIGRFVAAFGAARTQRLFRKDVKLHLCKSSRAKDPHVWQAIVDRYGPGKEKAIGKKRSPGPLYGVTSHQRAALAVGLCWIDGVRSAVDLGNPETTAVESLGDNNTAATVPGIRPEDTTPTTTAETA